MEQLQQTLNKAIEMWWKPRWDENVTTDSLDEFWLYQIHWWWYYSYHDIFSKDSWIMEFMKWKWSSNIWITLIWLNGFKLEKDKAFSNKQEMIESISIKNNELNYHYMMMWSMSTTDKIDYFNQNAYL
jgi:hypothetical protein